MDIKIPAIVIQVLNVFKDWANVPIANVSFQILRVDIIAVIGFIGIVAFNWFLSGWVSGLRGGALYGFIFLMGLLLRGRSEEESKENKKTSL